MTHYLATMQTFGYVYDTVWLPHDAENQTLAAAGRSIDDIVRAAGYKTRILPKVPILIQSTQPEQYSQAVGLTVNTQQRALTACATIDMRLTQTQGSSAATHCMITIRTGQTHSATLP
jgi:hypothetical protein